jgi:hypothetical protein
MANPIDSTSLIFCSYSLLCFGSYPRFLLSRSLAITIKSLRQVAILLIPYDMYQIINYILDSDRNEIWFFVIQNSTALHR